MYRPPLAVEIIFSNTKYGSYNNSAKFRDGIAKALTLIAVVSNGHSIPASIAIAQI